MLVLSSHFSFHVLRLVFLLCRCLMTSNFIFSIQFPFLLRKDRPPPTVSDLMNELNVALDTSVTAMGEADRDQPLSGRLLAAYYQISALNSLLSLLEQQASSTGTNVANETASSNNLVHEGRFSPTVSNLMDQHRAMATSAVAMGEMDGDQPLSGFLLDAYYQIVALNSCLRHLVPEASNGPGSSNILLSPVVAEDTAPRNLAQGSPSAERGVDNEVDNNNNPWLRAAVIEVTSPSDAVQATHSNQPNGDNEVDHSITRSLPIAGVDSLATSVDPPLSSSSSSRGGATAGSSGSLATEDTPSGITLPSMGSVPSLGSGPSCSTTTDETDLLEGRPHPLSEDMNYNDHLPCSPARGGSKSSKESTTDSK